MSIKAIIFDLGGVLVRTADFSPREQLAARLGMSRAELEDFIFGGESGEKAQRGEITAVEHWENLYHKLNYPAEEFRFIVDEFFRQDQLDDELVDYVRRLHKTYKTALLSNAWDDQREVIAERWHIEDAFDVIISSSKVGMVKPDRRIFELTLERLGSEACQTIFVDDMTSNVEGARAIGMQAIQFLAVVQVRRDIERLLNGS